MPQLTSDDILILLEGNFALQPTRMPTDLTVPIEVQRGGLGDAMPLSHLVRAEKVVEFVTLASCLLHPDKSALSQDEQEQMRRVLKEKYDQYVCHSNFPARHPESPRDEGSPLVLGYAKCLKIDIALNETSRLPEHEEQILARFYSFRKTIPDIRSVFKGELFFGSSPYLCQALTAHFENALRAQLAYHYRPFSDLSRRVYLLISTIGQTGAFMFLPKDVKAYIVLESAECCEAQVEKIFGWLQKELSVARAQKEREIAAMPLEEPACPIGWRTVAAAAMTIGFFAVIKGLAQQVKLNSVLSP